MTTVEFHPEHAIVTVRRLEVETYFILRDADGHLIEPKCPQCQSAVIRPRCPFELASDCPRHPLREAYIQAKRALEEVQGLGEIRCA